MTPNDGDMVRVGLDANAMRRWGQNARLDSIEHTDAATELEQIGAHLEEVAGLLERARGHRLWLDFVWRGDPPILCLDEASGPPD